MWCLQHYLLINLEIEDININELEFNAISFEKFQYFFLFNVFSAETITFRMNYNWQISSRIIKRKSQWDTEKRVKKLSTFCIFLYLVDSLNSRTFHCSFLIHLQMQTIFKLRMDIFILQWFRLRNRYKTKTVQKLVSFHFWTEVLLFIERFYEIAYENCSC